MALDVSKVVSVTVNVSPKAASVRGFGQCLIVGTTKVIPKEERIRYYSSLEEVGTDFAADTDEYKMAATYFSQSQTPAELAIGYWDNTQKGTKTVAQGGVIENVKSLFVDGAMAFSYDSAPYDMNIDLSSCSSMEQVLAILNQSFILKGTGTPAIPAQPQQDEVKNSISAKQDLADDGDGGDETIDWATCGTADSIKLIKRSGFILTNTDCTTEFAAVNNYTTLQTALNAGFTGQNVEFKLMQRQETGKYYITVINQSVVTDEMDNIVSLEFEGTLSGKMGETGGFNVVDYVPFIAEQPAKPAVPAVYFATATYEDDRITIVPNEMGKPMTLPTTSTRYPQLADLSVLMGFDKGQIKTVTVLEESASEIISIMADKSQSWYACMFSTALQDEQIIETSKVIEGLSPVRLIGHTLQSPDEPTSNVSVGSQLKDRAFKRTVCQYDPTNRFAIASYVAKMCSTNFNGNNTVITLKFKQEPSVAALELTSSESTYLNNKNINCFVKYSNDTAIIQEGKQMNGDWSDEVIGLDWLQNYVQSAVYNVLYTSTTKIPQTNQGSAMLLSVVNNALDRAMQNGLIGAGVWNGIEFGSLKTGSYLQNGYYTYVNDINLQSKADRENRKAPSIICAVKLTGAFHSADVVINVER